MNIKNSALGGSALGRKKGNVAIIAVIIAVVAVTAGVVGYLFAKKTQAPAAVPAITQPVVQTPTQPVVADETANWKTYTNTKYGFEIKYPKEWALENTNYDYQNGVGLASVESAKIITKNKSQGLAYQYDIAVVVSDNISSLPGAKDSSIKNIDEYIQKNNVQYGVLYNPAKVTFTGKEAYSFVATGLTDNYTIIAEEGGKIYEIMFFKKSSDSELTTEQKKILSTFKFTDSTADETANWQTYKNTNYGFEVKYPKEWTQSGDRLMKANESMLFFFVQSTSYKSIQDWFSNEFKNRAIAGKPVVINLNIAGNAALAYEDPEGIGGCEKSYVFIKDSILYDLQQGGGTCSYSEDVFNKILSTFKFTK